MPPVTTVAAPLPLPSLHSAAAHDSVSNSLGDLAVPEMRHLLQIVEDRLFPAGSQHIESVHAPHHPAVAGFYSDPAQAVAQRVDVATLDAKDVAERSVARAAHAIEMAGERGRLVSGNPDPQAVLAVANQFIETGQLANYLRATELGRVVFARYEEPLPVPAIIRSERAARQRELRLFMSGAIARLWRRAPLLVLLTGWLLMGAIAGIFLRVSNVPADESARAFNIWAIGFLALVVFQFVATIRGALRPKSGNSPER